MTSKTPNRTCDDVDQQALSYAEIKALCVGNPMIKEKIDLETEISKLKIQESAYRNQKYRFQDNLLTHIPAKISHTNQNIENLKADIATLEKHPVKEQLAPAEIAPVGAADTKPKKDDTVSAPFTIEGKVYNTTREEAGKALITAAQSIDKTGSVYIGEYRGFALHLKYDTFAQTHKIELVGKNTYTCDLAKIPNLCITRIDSVLNEEALLKKIDDGNNRLVNYQNEIEAIKKEFDKPFEFKELLETKTKRLEEVEIALAQADSIIIEEPGENELCKQTDTQSPHGENKSNAKPNEQSATDVPHQTAQPENTAKPITAGTKRSMSEIHAEVNKVLSEYASSTPAPNRQSKCMGA